MIVFSSGATPACTSVQPTAASASVDTPATSAPRRSWSRMLSLCAAAYNALYSQTLNCGSKSCVLWRVLVDLDGERACYGDCGILSLSISLNHFSSLFLSLFSSLSHLLVLFHLSLLSSGGRTWMECNVFHLCCFNSVFFKDSEYGETDDTKDLWGYRYVCFFIFFLKGLWVSSDWGYRYVCFFFFS